jgi:hypothetical protein
MASKPQVDWRGLTSRTLVVAVLVRADLRHCDDDDGGTRFRMQYRSALLWNSKHHRDRCRWRRATIAPIAPALTTTSGNFSTDEIWLVGTNSAYWVEIGYTADFTDINVLSQGVDEFWFDSRPGGGMHGQVLRTYPTLSARTFYVMRSSPSTTCGVGDGILTPYSTANSMTPSVVEVGSETTTGSTCSTAHDSAMSYSTGEGWLSFLVGESHRLDTLER